MITVSDAYGRFCYLLKLAEDYFAAGDFAAAVALAQIAARCAFPDHSGLFASPRLERLLLELGKQVATSRACGAGRRDENSRNILHVLTYARPAGGDTRFVWRWIREDRDNRHSVAITTQDHMKGVYDVPDVLRQAAESSGGFLQTLSASASKPMEQARELRALCQEIDIVILHLWPYDIVPVLALAAGCDAVKTLFVNHSDHTFWIGASVSHSVVHLRRQSPDFLTNRRGLNPNRSSIIPIPLQDSPPSATPIQAKRALGYEHDVVLLLTIASPFKYSSPGQISFLDLVTPVLLQFPQAVLMAVGPQPDDEAWRSASIQTNGRIVALGTRYDNNLRYSAADIYLDSIPFSSITSLLEAGSHGVPLLGYRSPNPELGLLGPGAPGLENAMQLAEDAESYRIMLTRLVGDAQFRRQSGELIQEQIRWLHTGSNWIHTVRDVYAYVDSCNQRGCMRETCDSFEMTELDTKLSQLYSHAHDPTHVRRLIRNYVGALPYWSRLSITRRLYLEHFDMSYLNLVPPPLNEIIRYVGRPAYRVIRRLLQPRGGAS